MECQPVTLSNEQPTKEWVSASARTAERPAAQNGTHGKDKKNKEKTLCAVSLPMSESWCYPAGGLKTGRIQQRSGSYLEVMKTQQTESSVAVYPVRRVGSVQDFRHQDTLEQCRADYDQGPHGYPVSEVEPMPCVR